MQGRGEVTGGFLAALLAAAIWGGTYVVSRVVLETIPPATLVMLRMFLAGMALLAFLRLRGRAWRPPRQLWQAIGVTGLVGNALSIVSQFQGTAVAGAAAGSVITTSAPVVTVALAALTGRERVRPLAWLGLGFAVVGVWVLSAPGGADPTGVAWLVLAAVSWGVLGHVGGGAAREHDPALLTAWACLVAGVALLPLAVVEIATGRVGPLTPAVSAGVAYLSFVATALAFALWVYGVARAGAVASGVAFFAQPLVGGLLGFSLLGEKLGPGFLAGAVLIAVGGAIASQRAGASPPSTIEPLPD